MQDKDTAQATQFLHNIDSIAQTSPQFPGKEVHVTLTLV